jgi:DNA (cytosine-5)-methyltransferase 1
MKYLSVCSGIEAATVAWHPLGWEAVGFSEIEKFPSQVLAHHYPNVPNLGDMTKFKEWNFESNIDVFVGGTPCQSFSVAGLRKGLDDPRGNLMLTYLAIADKLRPRWLVWENVPGVLSSNGGKDFGTFLGGLGELGYGFAYRVLDAQYFGVAQRRRRVFVVGYLGDWRRAAAVLFERHSLSGDLAPRREKRQGATASVASGVAVSDYEVAGTLDKGVPGRGIGHNGNYDSQVVSIAKQWPSEVAPTLTTDFADKLGQNNQHIDGQRGGFFVPVQPIALAENTIGRQPENGGNGDGFTDGGPMYTLNATGVHGVAQPIAYNIAPGKGLLKNDIHITNADATKTLDASGSNPAMHQGGAAIVQPIFFEPRSPDGVPRIYPMEGAAPTLNTMGGGQREPCVTHAVGTDLYNAAITGDIAATMSTHGSNSGGSGPTVMHQMAVRRLTPKECERLQGFPDNYTDIMPKGKATPDGSRYKALGNSMAVPVMAWIGKRIQEVENL